MRKKVLEACRKASVVLNQRSENMGHVHMGTTMVLASIENNKLTIAHIGDSRCYLLRKGFKDWNKNIISTSLSQICCDVVYQTKDHENYQFGWGTLASCFFYYCPEDAMPDIRVFEKQSGDIVFLCSDGVNKYIQSEILKDFLLMN